jgi:hypothetical protein
LLDVFDHLNEQVGNVSQANITAELERHLESKKRERERLKKQIVTEHGKVNQFFGGLQFNHFVFLLVLGFLTAITCYALDLTVFEVNSSKPSRVLAVKGRCIGQRTISTTSTCGTCAGWSFSTAA